MFAMVLTSERCQSISLQGARWNSVPFSMCRRLCVPDCGSHYGNVLEPEHTGSKRSGEWVGMALAPARPRALGRAANESRLPWPVDVRGPGRVSGRHALLATAPGNCWPRLPIIMLVGVGGCLGSVDGVDRVLEWAVGSPHNALRTLIYQFFFFSV
jgi:hypothetical protein